MKWPHVCMYLMCGCHLCACTQRCSRERFDDDNDEDSDDGSDEGSFSYSWAELVVVLSTVYQCIVIFADLLVVAYRLC